MRHEYTTKVVIGVSVLLVAAVVLFAVLALRDDDGPADQSVVAPSPAAGPATPDDGDAAPVGTDAPTDRVEVALGLQGDADAGRVVFIERSSPSCGSCHALSDAAAEGGRASDLDNHQFTAREIAASLVGGTIRAHDAQEYAVQLSDQDVADVVAYLRDLAGD